MADRFLLGRPFNDDPFSVLEICVDASGFFYVNVLRKEAQFSIIKAF